jgi:hypothetical protein
MKDRKKFPKENKQTQQSLFWIYNQRRINQCILKIPALLVHGSMIHNSQDMGTTSVSASG